MVLKILRMVGVMIIMRMTMIIVVIVKLDKNSSNKNNSNKNVNNKESNSKKNNSNNGNSNTHNDKFDNRIFKLDNHRIKNDTKYSTDANSFSYNKNHDTAIAD